MKKSVILIISTLSLLAIILIGLLFQRAEIYNVTIYTYEIVCTDIRIGDEYYPTYWDEERLIYRIADEENPGEALTLVYVPNLTIDIIYEVYPSNVTNPSVQFYTDPNSPVASIDAATGRVSFRDEGTETFTLRANDNSNKSTRIRLRAKVPEL